MEADEVKTDSAKVHPENLRLVENVASLAASDGLVESKISSVKGVEEQEIEYLLEYDEKLVGQTRDDVTKETEMMTTMKNTEEATPSDNFFGTPWEQQLRNITINEKANLNV